jgi:two-component system sensor histidine kinase MprB
MVLLAAGAVAAAVVLASVVVYVVTRDELRAQIDSGLRLKLTPGLPQAVQVQSGYVSRAAMVKLEREGKAPPQTIAQLGLDASGSAVAPARGTSRGKTPAGGSTRPTASPNGLFTWQSFTGAASPGTAPPAGGKVTVRSKAPTTPVLAGTSVKVVLPTQQLGGATGYAQLVQPGHQVLRSDRSGSGLPVTAATRAVAAGRRPAFFSDATVGHTHVRMLTERAPLPGAVWQVALPLTEIDSTLAHLELVLALVSLGGVALAAALGLIVSRAALVPVSRLTGAAERVARTQDLGHRIESAGDDELGRLAASFNTMLAALEHSRLAQRQLVSDASHELRTPLTSVQANLDALAVGDRLTPSERARVVRAAQAQLRELTVLVGDLVDLSKTEVDEVEVEELRLDLAAAGAVERARLHAPRCRFELNAHPCLVRANPALLDRAIANLLDNAVKWGPTEGPVEAVVRGGRLDVRDHGDGIDDADLARVFDRFYRAPAARARPGSGLGLAIVRHVAETHGGAVHAANDPDGGARLTLELPELEMTASESAAWRADHAAASGAVRR